MGGDRQVDKISTFPTHDDGPTDMKICKAVCEGNSTTPWCTSKYSFGLRPEIYLKVLGKFVEMHGDSAKIEYDIPPAN